MWYFIAAWIVGGLACWYGVWLWSKKMAINAGLSEEERRSMIKTGPSEVLKIPIYLVIWPICLLSVLYNAWYMKHITKKVFENFVTFMEES